MRAATPRRTIATLVALARARGIPLASHDDTTAEHVAQSIDDRVAIAEFPTTVEAAQALHAGGVRVLMGAPNLVRGGSHSGNVATAELARAGVLDVLSSDYVPASLLMAALRLPQRGARDLAAGGGAHRHQDRGRGGRPRRSRRDRGRQARRSHPRPCREGDSGGPHGLARRTARRVMAAGDRHAPDRAGAARRRGRAERRRQGHADRRAPGVRLAGDPAFVFPLRLVTRAASAAEDHLTISDGDFATAVRQRRLRLLVGGARAEICPPRRDR